MRSQVASLRAGSVACNPAASACFYFSQSLCFKRNKVVATVCNRRLRDGIQKAVTLQRCKTDLIKHQIVTSLYYPNSLVVCSNFVQRTAENVQETLAHNTCLILSALCSHASFVVHTLTQIIFLLSPIHIFVGKKPGAKQWKDLLDHTVNKRHSRKQP